MKTPNADNADAAFRDSSIYRLKVLMHAVGCPEDMRTSEILQMPAVLEQAAAR